MPTTRTPSRQEASGSAPGVPPSRLGAGLSTWRRPVPRPARAPPRPRLQPPAPPSTSREQSDRAPVRLGTCRHHPAAEGRARLQEPLPAAWPSLASCAGGWTAAAATARTRARAAAATPWICPLWPGRLPLAPRAAKFEQVQGHGLRPLSGAGRAEGSGQEAPGGDLSPSPLSGASMAHLVRVWGRRERGSPGWGRPELPGVDLSSEPGQWSSPRPIPHLRGPLRCPRALQGEAAPDPCEPGLLGRQPGLFLIVSSRGSVTCRLL